MNQSLLDSRLRILFETWAGEPCCQLLALGANGSNRRYFRLASVHKSAIGAYNEDIRENEAFFYYSRLMKERQLPVPELYAVDEGRRIYLQQDLGDTTLYGYLFEKRRQGGGFDSEMLDLYKQVLSDLVQIQTRCCDFDFTKAYPRSSFDRQSIQWDLNYFKYYFLKLAYIPFDEQLLEEDFSRFTDYLLEEPGDYFMYRDFQSRNIMMATDPCQPTRQKLYYIDYQGGRRGPAQYDVASLLYSAKSDLPEPIRQELLNYYIDEFFKTQKISKNSQRKQQFQDHFYGYVLVRLMQAMGAYGYRGYFERKDYFLQSIPLAVNNLRMILENHPLPIELPHLTQVWRSIVDSATIGAGQDGAMQDSTTLTVTVESFSYKKGLPQDPSGNGGGFVFDCRALPNPGRYPEYKSYTGKDRPVIEFLQRESAVDHFLEHAELLVSQAVEKYLERHFTHLMVSFGCTGGQHRSVYCAEQMAAFLGKKYPCKVVVVHREQY